MRWWIDPPLIIGSHNPTDAEVAELHRQGVITIISLLVDSAQPPRYDVGRLAALGITRYAIPIPDFTAPTWEQFQHFVELIHSRVQHGPVLVHCQGGSGRTGTMAAAYWISRGMPPAEAIAKVREANPAAIETATQCRSLYGLSARRS